MGMGCISMNMLPLPNSEIQSHVHQVDYYRLGVQLHSHAESFGKVKNLLLIFKLDNTVTKKYIYFPLHCFTLVSSLLWTLLPSSPQ